MNDTEFEDHLQRTSTYQRSFHFVDDLFDLRDHLDKFRGIGLNQASIIFFFSFANLFFNLISAQV